MKTGKQLRHKGNFSTLHRMLNELHLTILTAGDPLKARLLGSELLGLCAQLLKYFLSRLETKPSKITGTQGIDDRNGMWNLLPSFQFSHQH
jgi:hypothetical protein